jgi:hypothetical protein
MAFSVVLQHPFQSLLGKEANVTFIFDLKLPYKNELFCNTNKFADIYFLLQREA